MLLIYFKVGFFQSFPPVAGLSNRSKIAPLFHSFNQLLEEVDAVIFMRIQKPADIQVFQII